ncbi:hypothetical protein [Edaphobacter flagellatus]|uniref:hypothetical protein n=1 Tax=Edaphobacter flagellatus TaxID=1933044 RepID=UPI0021B2616F|nr:hypothetical protein [Edaphobacter flagellatus]
MQVLCTPSDATADVQCPVCHQGFRLFWERRDLADQQATLPKILNELREQHEDLAADAAPHPAAPFNIPSWAGQPQFSGAALLGGAY